MVCAEVEKYADDKIDQFRYGKHNSLLLNPSISWCHENWSLIPETRVLGYSHITVEFHSKADYADAVY